MSKMSDSKNRAVCDVGWEAFGGYDEGAFVTSASYLDCSQWLHLLWSKVTGKYCKCHNPVPDDELEYLTDAYPEEGDQHVFEAAVDAAERYYEGDR